MAPPRRPWFRFYVEAIHDRKLRRLPPAQRWLWVVVLGVARGAPLPGFLVESGSDGVLVELAIEDLADIAALAPRDVRAGLTSFSEAGMLSRDALQGAWFVTKWNERQFETDEVRLRTSKHRSHVDGTSMERSIEHQWNVPSTLDGTPYRRRSVHDGTPPDTETETDTDQTLASAPPNAPEAPPKSAVKTPRAADHLWDALMAACGIEGPVTPSARGAYNRAVADLRGIEATPEEIGLRARAYRKRFPDAALTPTALTKHWAELNGHVKVDTAGGRPREFYVANDEPIDHAKALEQLRAMRAP